MYKPGDEVAKPKKITYKSKGRPLFDFGISPIVKLAWDIVEMDRNNLAQFKENNIDLENINADGRLAEYIVKAINDRSI